MMKRLLAIIVTVCLISIPVPTLASINQVISKESILQENTILEKKLVNYINEKLDKNQDIDSILNMYFSNNKNSSVTTDNVKNMHKNKINKKVDTTYTLKGGRTITFSKNGLTFSVSDYPIIQSKSLGNTEIGNTNGSVLVTASYPVTYVPQFTATHTWYNWLGSELFSVSAEGYFKLTSDGKVVPYLVNAWYNKGFLSMWQVSNWASGIFTHDSGYRAEFYAQGNFHWGLEIKGYGFVVDDLYCKVYGFCYGESIGHDLYGSSWEETDL